MRRDAFLKPPPIGGGHFVIARSVRLSVPWHSCPGYRHAGCMHLSHHRSPEMCGLRTRPRTDIDPPRRQSVQSLAFFQAEWIAMLTDCTSVPVALSQVDTRPSTRSPPMTGRSQRRSVPILRFKVRSTDAWRARRARAYNGGLWAEPPAGFRGRAPGQGVRGAKPP